MKRTASHYAQDGLIRPESRYRATNKELVGEYADLLPRWLEWADDDKAAADVVRAAR